MTVSEFAFGATGDGKVVNGYWLINSKGTKVKLITLGASIVELWTRDIHGTLNDIVLGHDKCQDYVLNTPYFGSIVGRFANRIHKGKFSVDGKDYQLEINNGPNHLHGGKDGFGKRIWDCNAAGDSKVIFRLVSEDGDQGYPGQVALSVAYELNEENELLISYSATSTKATPVNFTNHVYFNLSGHNSGTIYDHRIFINADEYTPKNADGVPDGRVAPVDVTVFDLRNGALLRERIHHDSLARDRGFDHNFCLKSDNATWDARVEDAGTGRFVECYTDQPGLQLYTGNYIPAGHQGKDGASYDKHGGFCLETQNYPDAPNHAKFPNSILKPGDVYETTTRYKFGTFSP